MTKWPQRRRLPDGHGGIPDITDSGNISTAKTPESGEMAQLVAAMPESGKAAETSPLLPSEVEAGNDTSPSALAQGEPTPPPLAAPTPAAASVPVPAMLQASNPIEHHAVSDERIRGIIQEQVLEVLDSPAVQQKLFAMLALETAVNPSALSEMTGIRAFLKVEIERMIQQHSSDSVL